MPGEYEYEHKTCSIEGCGLTARYLAPDLCGGHYQQVWRGSEAKPLRRKRKVVDGMKECRLCGIVKPLDGGYYKRGNGCAPECIECLSILNRANKYGVSFDTIKSLLEQPCAGCGATENLHIDHDHTHGIVRGVLCHNCNTVLTVHMTPATLRRLADYLEPFHNL